MPALQLHQLRVAGVAKIVCENIEHEIDADAVILACLFHDMGNIIKSDLSAFPEFSEPEGEAHWQLVKQQFEKRFGKDEHKATEAICKDAGLSEQIRMLIRDIGFSKLGTIMTKPWGLKVFQYADLRVGPHGVLSLEARLAEGRERYRGHKEYSVAGRPERYERLVREARELERHVFATAAIAPEDIIEQSVEPFFEALRTRVVEA